MSDKKTPRRILVINPGSTSTKVGVFEGDECKLSKNVAHDAKDLAQFDGVSAQMPYRCDLILGALEEAGLKLEDFDAFVGRGGGLLSLPGGTYAINEVMLEHARVGANGIQHPAQLGPQIAHEFASKTGKPSFVVNPPDTDELWRPRTYDGH